MRAFVESETELVEYYTNTRSLRGQRYERESFGGLQDTGQIGVAIMDPNAVRARRQLVTVRRTLERIGGPERRVLELTYEPSRHVNDLLRLAIPGMAWLACHTRTAAKLVAKRMEAQGCTVVSVGPIAVARMLEDEAGRNSQKLIKPILDESKSLLMAALGAYDVARLERIEQEKAERQAERAERISGLFRVAS